MGSPKDEVNSLLRKLPDDASFEDIQYHSTFSKKYGGVPHARMLRAPFPTMWRSNVWGSGSRPSLVA